MSADLGVDALLPAEIAQKAEAVGVKKAGMPFWSVFALAVLAGAFVALGAVFATTLTAGSLNTKGVDGILVSTTGLTYGLTRLLAGLAFTLGLVLVVISGAELFTGNNLIVMAFMGGKVSLGRLLRNWGIVYLGNFVGSVLTAGLMLLTRQYTFGGGAVGVNALTIAAAKVNFTFVQAVALGILCNALVCLAVWMTYGARSTTDKIAAIILPITAFVAASLEHSVANMYYLPIALLIKQFDPGFTAEHVVAGMEKLSWGSFLSANLLPVTIGNIIGGAVLVGLVYWFVYLRGAKTREL